MFSPFLFDYFTITAFLWVILTFFTIPFWFIYSIFLNFIIIIIIIIYFTILYWFCHTSTWICHGCARVPQPEPPSHLPSRTISLGHPSAPAPSILYHASNLDWRFISYMILYMFQCHSPKSSHPLPSPSPTESKRLFDSSVSLKKKNELREFKLTEWNGETGNSSSHMWKKVGEMIVHLLYKPRTPSYLYIKDED